jgi:opacity protein-like surface antigen
MRRPGPVDRLSAGSGFPNLNDMIRSPCEFLLRKPRLTLPIRMALAVLVHSLFLGTFASAQIPPIAASGPSVQVGIGYEYLSRGLPGTQRINLQGVDLNFTADIRRRFGITADLSYARASHVLGAGRHADSLTYLAGPVFYPWSHRRTRTYVHALAGGSRETGVIPFGTGVFGVYADEPAWEAGAGVEYQIVRSFAVRGEANYLRTSFLNQVGDLKGENDFRTVLRIVYNFRQGTRRR